MESQEYLELLDRIDAAGAVAARSVARWSVADVLTVQDRLEVHRRRQPTVEHRLIGRITEVGAAELGGSSVRSVLIHRLRLSEREAARRIGDARLLAPDRTVTGEHLEPVLPGCAGAQADGAISTDHVSVITKALDDLPSWVDPHTRARVERDLARHAHTLSPDQLRTAARALVDLIDPDGPEPEDTAPPRRRRGWTLGPQRRDGTSDLRGEVTAEQRAYLEALWAKWAATGMCHPEDCTPCVDADPDPDQVRRDRRSPAQRRHDAMTAALRAILAAGLLGSQHGLPVTVIATTTVAELQRGAGQARTATGTVLDIGDLIRMASHAYHYLAVFDTHTQLPLYLGRSRRTASAAQRLVLHGMDGGCTRPGCTVPAAWCQVDHLKPWAQGGPTDITNTGLACGPDNRMKEQGWTTRRISGRVHWIPPEHLDTGQPRINSHHHPHEYLTEPSDASDKPDDEAGESSAPHIVLRDNSFRETPQSGRLVRTPP